MSTKQQQTERLTAIAGRIRTRGDALTAKRREVCAVCEHVTARKDGRVQCALCGCEDPPARRPYCPAGKWGQRAFQAMRKRYEAGQRGRVLIIVNGGLGDAVMATPCAVAVHSMGHEVLIWAMRGNAARLNPLWAKLDGITPVRKGAVAGQRFAAILGPTQHKTLLERASAFQTDQVISPSSHSGQPVGVAMRMAGAMGYVGETPAQPFAALLPDVERDAILIGPGVGPREANQAKRWDRWWSLIRRLPKPAIIIGDESARIEEAKPWPGIEDMIGKTPNITDLLPVLARAKAYIGVDNGLGHLAAACGIPTVTIFVATDPAKFTPAGGHGYALRAGPDIEEQIYDRLKCAGALPVRPSVVITTHNEGTQVRRTIESVNAASEEPPECIVVDEASDPSVAGVPAIIIRHEAALGVAPARNVGIAQAHGDTILVLDAHMRITDNGPDILSRVAYEDDCVALAGCSPLGRPGDRFGCGARMELHEGHIRNRWAGPKRGQKRWTVAGWVAPGWCIRRDTFNRIGGWPAALGGWGHTEITMSIKTAMCGIPVTLCADVTAEHMFRRRAHYRISPSRTWLNRFVAARVLFEERTYREYWKPAMQKYPRAWNPKFEEVLESPAVRQEAERFATIKTRTDAEFFRDFLGLGDPLAPLSFDDAPAPLHTGRRAAQLREALVELTKRAPQPQILEIGSVRSREDTGDGQATLAWAWYVHRRAGHFVTIDVDPKAATLARELTRPWRRVVEVHEADALTFKPEVKHQIDLLYLDAWDHRTEEREGHHLKVMEAWLPHMTPDALVLIDDIGDEPASGKGARVVPFLVKRGWRVLSHNGGRRKQCLLSRT